MIARSRSSRPASSVSLLVAAAFAACSGAPAPTPDASPPADVVTNPAPTPDPATPPSTTTADNPLVRRFDLANEVDVVMLRHQPGLAMSAEVAVMLAGGTDLGAQGAADLATYLLVHGADVTAGRLSLQQRIENLGGTLAVEQGRRSTFVCARVPQESWQKAHAAIAGALLAPPPGRGQLERAQLDLLARRTAAIQGDPIRETVRRLLLGDESPSAHVQSVQDRDPTEAVQFQKRYFRPDSTVLALRVPGTPEQVEALAKKEFGSWTATKLAPEPESSSQKRVAPSGIVWIERSGDSQEALCEVELLLQWPSHHADDAASLHLLSNCITQDGIGGRLERLMQESGLGGLAFAARVATVGEDSALVLRAELPIDGTLALWNTIALARRSLRDLPPTSSERSQARGAAWLSLRSSEDSAATAMRAMVERIILQLDERTILARMDSLTGPEPVPPAIIERYLELPFALIVRGPKPQSDRKDLRLCELLPSDRRAPPTAAPDDALLEAGKPWLSRTAEAIGGQELLSRVTGLGATRMIATEGAPDIEETFRWTLAGTLQRSRTVLGVVVETDLRASEWVESSGGKKVQLSPTEANWRMSEIERHPLALLANWQRSAMQFRMLTTREVGDREHVVLEAVATRFERLRIEVDRQSALVRVVEAWTLSPEGTPTRAVDTWSDYRTVDGLRVPFRCTTQIDDGQSTRVSTFSRVQPQTR